ncbi:MAG: VWA domain-containing protein [Acidobacteriota bacterium]
MALLVCALLPLRSSLATTPPGRASTTQDSEQLTLESAPVTIVAPAGRGQWTRRLAAFADAAAQAYTEILGAPPPPGTLRWAPDPMTATEIDARVTLEMGPQGASITFDDPFDIIAEDLGVAFAQGYARWLAAYSVARLYFTGTDEPGSWWIDGASLYMTELMARRERSTTPILYNIEGAYDRAARAGRPVPLGMEQDAGAGDAVRGKSLATFRLLAATYGEQAVAGLLAAIAAAPAGQGLREIAVASLPANLLPSPAELLGTWLEPTAAIDLGITDVRVGEGGSTIRGRVTRAGPVPVATRVEVRLATGELVYADIPASSESENWQLDVDAPPVDVRLDPDSLLPDVNRSNNRYGFGSAERIREFFPLDDLIDIGELHFDGTIEQVGRKRVENFSVTLENKTEEPVGLGVLVSAQWIDRPAARTQRRVFVMLPPGQRVVAHDFVEYPRRGTGAARIEARYWRAPDPDTLTERSMRDPADLLNSYVLIRQPAEATGAEGSPLERLQEEQTVSSVAELTVAGGGEPTFGGDAGETPPPPGVEAAGTDASVPFAVRIISPTANATPLGEMTFSVAVDGPEALLLELYVNDEIVGRGAGNAARATFTASEEENIYVLRAVAVGASGELVTDTRVLQRGAIGFTTSVDLVTLNVTVRQPGGGLVEGLNADDFVVVEDGVEQEIVNFSRGEDTAVFAAMLLDTSSSMIGGGINSARAGANRLIDALLRGNDRAMVLGFNDRLYLYSDFSGDIPALRAAIEATRPDGSTALYDAMVGALRKVNRRTGRRALIVLSDGLDVGSEFNFEDVLEYTRQSDVLVYTIGLQLMHDATDLGDASDVVRRSVENLQALAEATGGSSYFPLRLDELQEVYAEIAAELESQYSLSYYPSNQQWNGRWRELSVRLTSGAGGVQARPGYYGIRPSERQNP